MNKILIVIFVFFILSCEGFSLTLDDLSSPKPFAGKISNSDRVESVVENSVKKEEIREDNKVRFLRQKNSEKPLESTQKNQEKKQLASVDEKQTATNDKSSLKSNEKLEEVSSTVINSNYADLSLKRLADDISYELELDSAKTNSDLNILWAAATERSETMKYTIYKLSNPDEDKPDESTIKKILRPIANASSVVGASVSPDPFVAAGALVGGGLVNAFMKDDKELNYKFSKVSDADMVLLVRKIGDLQKKLLDLYTDYKTKQQLAKMAEENLEKREVAYKNSQHKTKEELVISDVYYRTAKTNYSRAQDEYTIARAILENLVGTEALAKIEE